jgi:hypothetical protein
MTRTNQRIDRMTRPRKTVFRSATSPLAVCGFALFTGCQSLVGPLDVGGAGPVGQVTAEDADSSANPVVQVSAESTIAEKTKQTTTTQNGNRLSFIPHHDTTENTGTGESLLKNLREPLYYELLTTNLFDQHRNAPRSFAKQKPWFSNRSRHPLMSMRRTTVLV